MKFFIKNADQTNLDGGKDANLRITKKIREILESNERIKEIPLQELAAAHVECYQLLSTIGKIIGESVCYRLKPLIPDITFSIGWEESGIDTICFYSKQFSTRFYPN